ncbi:Uncharacterised protein [Shigella sonnei]|nr:Uncharacterised protein [Shigella sonnei]
MHSDYYNMVFGEKLANILYEAHLILSLTLHQVIFEILHKR